LVKLRLKRIGKRHFPVYKIVAANSRSPRDGRFIEAVGLYNPNSEPAEITLKEERVMHWLSKGALPTETVRSLLRREGLIMKYRLMKAKIDEEGITAKMNSFYADKENKIDRIKARKLRQKQNKAKKSEQKTEVPKAE
jgi:small subunit ribosomal protein S16